jgi:hypothetical protein
MSSFGQDFLQGFTATNSLRDYTHASKTFTTNAYELKPRFKFLFTVQFTLNVEEIQKMSNATIFSPTQLTTISLSVKTVDLPKYNIDVATLNQYNRKRIVQTKINYEPINITFHDDGGDNIREMWYQYYSYYYKDPSQQYINNAPISYGTVGANQLKQNGFSYNSRDIYEQQRVGSVSDWGYIGENFMDGTQTASGKPPFFKDIQIIGFDQHKYARYILINPLITNWNHDTYDYAQGNGTMQHTMTVRYETVKYLNGALGKPDVNINWPDTAHYDTVTSPIARPGSTATVFGQGGLLSTGEGILADLESGSVAGLIGAAQKAGAAYNTFKGKNLRSIVQNEATSLGKQVISQNGPNAIRSVINKADGWAFPVQSTQRQLTRDINAPGAAGILAGGGGV